MIDPKTVLSPAKRLKNLNMIYDGGERQDSHQLLVDQWPSSTEMMPQPSAFAGMVKVIALACPRPLANQGDSYCLGNR
jgi:hypothetical protein